MFNIQAHGIKYVTGTLSYAQNRLIHSQSPIRICGAPTGAGKTYAFIELAKSQLVFFVVPTQALAKDIENTALRENVRVERWDFTNTLQWLAQGKEPWLEKKGHLEEMAMQGGMIVATLEALANLVVGKPTFKNVDTGVVDLLWKIQHLVFDEAHVLNERAFGLVHFMITLIAYLHLKNPVNAPKLSLLSATHSNLFNDFIAAGYLPKDFIDQFDEEIEQAGYDRSIHGNVAIACHDKPLIEVVEELASTLIPQLQDKSLLLIYDALAKFAGDESRLAMIFARCGLARNQVILINGQDKQTPYSWGSSDFDGGTAPLARHKVIIGTSAVEMGVNYQVNAAIIEQGRDAAALLQRIGRVARGFDVGVVHICRSSANRSKSFFRDLSQLSGDYTITQLRHKLEPLRRINFNKAKELGSAYWSMLGRKHPSILYDCAKPAAQELSGDNKQLVPGWRLNALHRIAATHNKSPHHQAFLKWLTQIDSTLQDVRGFSPTVRVRFKSQQDDYCEGEYSRDWIRSKLESPDDYDNDVLIYNQSRDKYLRTKAKPISYSFVSPMGGTITREALNIEDAQRQYINCLEAQKARYRKEPGFEEALEFSKLTGLVAQDNVDYADLYSIM